MGKMVWLFIVALVGASFVGGCAAPDESSDSSPAIQAPAPDLAGPISLSLEHVTTFGDQGLEGPISSGPSSLMAETQLELPPPPPPPESLGVPGWWAFMLPLRPRVHSEALPTVEAPALLARQILMEREQAPDCVTITETGVCPPDPEVEGSACVSLIEFDGACRLEFGPPQDRAALDISGAVEKLVTTIAPASAGAGGAFASEDRAIGLRVSDPQTGQGLTWNGKLVHAADATGVALPYDVELVTVNDGLDDPMTVMTDRGDILVADGIRRELVIPGDSIESHLDVFPSFYPAGQPPRRSHHDVTKTFARDGDTIHLGLNAVITDLDLDEVTLKTGQYDVARINDTKEVINGQGELILPDGVSMTSQLIDVTVDLNHRVPISGTEIITFDDGRTVTVTFTGVCSVSWEDGQGQSGKINLCQPNQFVPPPA